MKYFDVFFKLVLLILLTILIFSLTGLSDNGRYERYDGAVVLDTKTGNLYQYYKMEDGNHKYEYQLLAKGPEQ